jgi:hypothetical protein
MPEPEANLPNRPPGPDAWHMDAEPNEQTQQVEATDDPGIEKVGELATEAASVSDQNDQAESNDNMSETTNNDNYAKREEILSTRDTLRDPRRILEMKEEFDRLMRQEGDRRRRLQDREYIDPKGPFAQSLKQLIINKHTAKYLQHSQRGEESQVTDEKDKVAAMMDMSYQELEEMSSVLDEPGLEESARDIEDAVENQQAASSKPETAEFKQKIDELEKTLENITLQLQDIIAVREQNQLIAQRLDAERQDLNRREEELNQREIEVDAGHTEPGNKKAEHEAELTPKAKVKEEEPESRRKILWRKLRDIWAEVDEEDTKTKDIVIARNNIFSNKSDFKRFVKVFGLYSGVWAVAGIVAFPVFAGAAIKSKTENLYGRFAPKKEGEQVQPAQHKTEQEIANALKLMEEGDPSKVI